MKKILVVGAGFSGATVARELADAGKQVTVIDRRPHLGGNAYDYRDKHGIRIHMYGPHLFHTNNREVWDYLQRFGEWTPYKHKVKALHNGKYYTLPVNRQTAYAVGKDNVLDIFYRPYTRKMWGMELEQIDPDIVNRVKIRDDNNEYYFPDDEFQALPVNGYTDIIKNMLDHPNITTICSTSHDKHFEDQYEHIFNSMPIDEYWEYRFGALPWRSIKFHSTTLKENRIYPVATVNFTHDREYTRVTEWKHLPNHSGDSNYTTVTFEEPCDYRDNNMERYYPVKDINGDNRALYKKYNDLKHEKMTFIGRCGLYAYLDMHQAISSSLKIARDYLNS
jgi:UDP-galactopyranose mutase